MLPAMAAPLLNIEDARELGGRDSGRLLQRRIRDQGEQPPLREAVGIGECLERGIGDRARGPGWG